MKGASLPCITGRATLRMREMKNSEGLSSYV